MKLLFLLISFISFSFALSQEESKHLLNRTSFSYSQADLKLFQSFSKKEAISFLLNSAKDTKTLVVPQDLKEISLPVKNRKSLSREERKVLRKARVKKMKELQMWWYQMMLSPQHAFREKMTLFWHNHFVSSYKVVKNPYFMYKQNQLFRENALGNFDTFLHKSSKDLAMLIYLDNNSNKKSHPNENYARELLELFTLGEGNYSEMDIKEAARAFTGLRVKRKKQITVKIKKFHDYGNKTFLNQSGNFDAKDIIDIILQEDQMGVFIVSKLYKEFVSEEINDSLVKTLAKDFKESSYDISLLMQNLLLSDDFWNMKNKSIKSPAELMIGLIKNLDINVSKKELRFLIKFGKNLGQELFNPPNVKGWIGNKAWITSSSFVLRQNFIKKVVNRKLKNKKLKNFDINNYEEFGAYFYPIKSKKEYVFKNNKKHFSLLLTKSIYQLR